MKAKIVKALNVLFMNKSQILKKLIKKFATVFGILLFILLLKAINMKTTNALLTAVKNSISYEFNIIDDSRKLFNRGMELVDSSQRVLEVFNLGSFDKYPPPIQGNIHKEFQKNTNTGILIKADEDHEPKAIVSGIVSDVRMTESKGYFVNIQSEDFEHVYGYLSKPYVVIGDPIESGEPIGYLGTNKDGYKYLRFEILKDGEYTNPLNYIHIE